jgi:fumarylacetoacetase
VTSQLDNTHDVDCASWLASANAHSDFPIQNLPFGIFSTPSTARRPGVAIGDSILDLLGLAEADILPEACRSAILASKPGTLNALFEAGAAVRKAIRARVFALLEVGSERGGDLEPFLHRASRCELHVPAAIGGYTDFFAGIHHARNAGSLFRPENPLLPNYKFIPVAYHGRASSIRASGATVRRPKGQIKSADEATPAYRPSARLDYELELGFWIGSRNELGDVVSLKKARDHLAGVCLLNDWSARDIQAWEYQPLGPFLAKNFATTISPWVVTPEALAPFERPQPPRPNGDPAPLPHLLGTDDQASGAYDITLRAHLVPADGAFPAHKLSEASSLSLYWTVAQMIAHHTSGGCNLEPGDLLGSGTISGETPTSFGSLLEITRGGKDPLTLSNGQTRTFLQDGDTIVYTAHCERPGFARIGFGECRGTVVPAHP